VVRGLRAKYPEGKITLAVMDLFQETASLLPGVDRLLTFPSASLATLLDQEGGWPEAAQRLAEWLKGSFPQPPDLVVNLTPNRLGAFLAFATGAPEIRGMFVDPSLDLATQPAWASYALIVSRARQANPFNLVDLFLGEAGLPPDGKGLEVQVPGAAIREVQRFLSTLNLPPETALVGMFPGASQPLAAGVFCPGCGAASQKPGLPFFAIRERRGSTPGGGHLPGVAGLGHHPFFRPDLPCRAGGLPQTP
jgi:ADP-heptose:LPS heptosyltransferase